MKHYSLLRSVLALPLQWNRKLSPVFTSNCVYFQQPKRTLKYSTIQWNSHGSESEFVLDDEALELDNFTQDILHYKPQYEAGLSGRDVVVIMPRQKAGPLKKTKEQGQFLLDETITLVESISGWKVVGSHMISTAQINSKTIFGKTNLQYLKEYVRSTNASAVIFARDICTPYQNYFFQDFLDVEVYDRFFVVLRIFRERASTREAKIQLALAELNYVKKNLHFMKDAEFSQFSFATSFGGSFDTFYQVKKQLIQEKELKLKKQLEKVDKNNLVKKQHRMKVQIPSVAVVGYTNSGKTSLIKALTHDTKLTPEDRLFATVDVSVHIAHLPSNLKVLLIDTIGFISEMPTALIHSFRSTLSEICTADLLVHVTDSSNPDWQTQIETVHSTLREINVPERLIDSMIEVSNKVDKIASEKQDLLSQQSRLLVSATGRIGLDEVTKSIEKAIIANTDRLMFDIRVPNGGDQYQWLYRETTVVQCSAEEDGGIMKMRVIVTKSKLGKFLKHFKKSDVAY